MLCHTDAVFNFYSQTVENLTSSLVELRLALSTVGENSAMVFANNFSFVLTMVDKISTPPLHDIARMQLNNVVTMEMSLAELECEVKVEHDQLRMLTKLLNFTARDDKLSLVREQLQRIEVPVHLTSLFLKLDLYAIHLTLCHFRTC